MSKKIVFGPKKDFIWIDIKKDDENVVQELKNQAKLDQELLSYALDEHENAHVEYDAKEELLLIVFNVIKKHSERYETAPVAFIVKQNELYSFTTAKTAYVTEFIEGLITRQPALSCLSLIFKTLYQIVGSIFPNHQRDWKKTFDFDRKIKN